MGSRCFIIFCQCFPTTLQWVLFAISNMTVILYCLQIFMLLYDHIKLLILFLWPPLALLTNLFCICFMLRDFK
jgi:hypothetical protein